MLRFYIISTVLSWLVVYISVKSIEAKLKREGFVRKTKYTFVEKIHPQLFILLPIFNIFMALVGLFAQEKVYEKAKLDIIKEGQ